MGIILNPRGTGGSGKTELVRRIMENYGAARKGRGGNAAEPLYRTGRRHPFAYRFRHPFGGRPLIVIGHYEATSGGCDTIRAADGGLVEAIRSAGAFASSGHDVVIEGLLLSSDVEHSLALARQHRLRILRLNTPLRECVRNLARRRRAGREAFEAIEGTVTAHGERITQACRRLQGHAGIEDVTFDQALARAKSLLGLDGHRMVPGECPPPLTGCDMVG